MGGLTLGTVIDGINQEKATLNFDIAHQDLVVNSPDMASPVTQASLPKNGNLSLKVTDIPSKDMVKVLTDNLPGRDIGRSGDGAGQCDGHGGGAPGGAPDLGRQDRDRALSAARRSWWRSRPTALSTCSHRPCSALSAALNIAIRGIDDLLALAQKTPEDYDAQQAMGSIQMLQAYSAREQGADGKPVDKFKIEVNEAGQMHGQRQADVISRM